MSHVFDTSVRMETDLKFPTSPGTLGVWGLSLDDVPSPGTSLGGDPVTDHLDTPDPVETLRSDHFGRTLSTTVS